MTSAPCCTRKSPFKAYPSVEQPKKSTSKCYKCRKQGHTARDCKSQKKDDDSSFDSEAAHPAHVVLEAAAPFEGNFPTPTRS